MNNQNGRAAAYRKTAAGRVVTKEVELPSGAVFLLRIPNLEAFTVAGVLPVTLTAKMTAAQRSGQSAEDAFKDLPVEEQEKAFAFARKLLMHICIDPRLVDGDPQDGELALDELDKEDLRFLSEWANSGGGAAGSVAPFRGGPGQNAVGRAGRKK